ncbi:hypothetical protein DYBT9275_05955 [Dyadobacter sp. CECT 9275]|uniref:Uncharacterized protein n=1 Tax=Dyadobacter helix TaxID=2822344 RepID=A0A916JIQ7_9BACT|nr:hypothetical protein [Dyadobacter sp. CECT 9275]CAG5018205.1 hypothetical protein DYBT9275_05955 [Dyadobacter sp. CECT 9275]
MNDNSKTHGSHDQKWRFIFDMTNFHILFNGGRKMTEHYYDNPNLPFGYFVATGLICAALVTGLHHFTRKRSLKFICLITFLIAALFILLSVL